MSEVQNFKIELITKAYELLRSKFQAELSIRSVDPITEPGRRNQIVRLNLKSTSDQLPQSVLLKQTLLEPMGETDQEQMSRFAHDWAGLEFLHTLGVQCAPAFYEGDLEQRFILFEDLGLGHPSLVGPLTREYSHENLLEAKKSLEAYAFSLGQMHADSFGKTDLFASILTRIYPQTNRYHRLADEMDGENQFSLDKFTKFIQLEQPKKVFEEIESIIELAQYPNDFKVLIHGDICPDNVYLKKDRLYLIDFEYGDIGHAFIDGVYPRMSMPSCWCSRTIPSSFVEHLENIYRNELKKKIKSAGEDKAYQKAFSFGCAYWAVWIIVRLFSEKPIWKDLLSQEWNCPSGPIEADSKWDPSQNAYRPRILTRLKAFVDVSEKSGEFSALRGAVECLLKRLQKEWPETPYLGKFSGVSNLKTRFLWKRKNDESPCSY